MNREIFQGHYDSQAQSEQPVELSAYFNQRYFNLFKFSQQPYHRLPSAKGVKILNLRVGLDVRVPLVDSCAEQAQAHEQNLVTLRGLYRMRKWRKPNCFPLLRHKPSTVLPPHFKMIQCRSDSALHVSKDKLELNQCDAGAHSFLTSRLEKWEQDRKEGHERSHPSTYRADCIPPDHTVINAEPVASKNAVPSTHSISSLWPGRHSATTAFRWRACD